MAGNGNGHGKRPGPAIIRPGELDDAALLPRRFDQHVEDTRTSFDLMLDKIERLTRSIDDMHGELKSLRAGMRKLFAHSKANQRKAA